MFQQSKCYKAKITMLSQTVVVKLTAMLHCSTKLRRRTAWHRWSGNESLSNYENQTTSKFGYISIHAQDWEFTLHDSSQVSNSIGWPAYRWMPDGHLSTLWVPLSVVNSLQYDKTKTLTDIMMYPDFHKG